MTRLLIVAVLALLSLTADAKEIARAFSPVADLALTDERGPCPVGMQVAMFHPKGGAPLPGCWFEAFGVVWLIYADGDLQGLPRPLFIPTKDV